MGQPSIDYARYIDHTLLAADATEAQIKKICQEALQYHFYSVCVNSGYVPLVLKLLSGSDVKVCSVIGFPLGAALTSAKVFEAKAAIDSGADEIDMVINIGWMKSGEVDKVKADIQAVHQACQGKVLKVIFETCLLSEEEIVTLCHVCRDLKVEFVKTSTGFSKGGATLEVVALMRENVGDEIGVKASGGVRDQETADKMIAAGATRIGTSSGVAIVSGQKPTSTGY